MTILPDVLVSCLRPTASRTMESARWGPAAYCLRLGLKRRRRQNQKSNERSEANALQGCPFPAAMETAMKHQGIVGGRFHRPVDAPQGPPKRAGLIHRENPPTLPAGFFAVADPGLRP